VKLWTAVTYLLARYEVWRALSKCWAADMTNCVDCLSSELVPSLRLDGLRGSKDRVLAEVDQDGFVFAADSRDRDFFHGREWMVPRKHHRVQIVWSNGATRLRKAFLSGGKGILGWMRNQLQWELYVEAAALLRLRGLDGVPMVRHVNPNEGVVEMDYIWGRDLRQILADGGPYIDYNKVSKAFDELLSGATETTASVEVSELVERVMSRGVIPRDLHAANLIEASASRRLYLVDFNLVHLAPVPGWRSEVNRLRRIMRAPASRQAPRGRTWGSGP